jgi:hypothetical protein
MLAFVTPRSTIGQSVWVIASESQSRATRYVLIGVLAVLSLALSAGQVAQSSEWQGHLATLRQAQIACRNLNSRDCLPYLAEAVAVADVLTAATKVTSPVKGKVSITVVFRSGSEQSCSENWLRNLLNGQRLLHDALLMDARQHAYWTDALLAAAQNLCHS